MKVASIDCHPNGLPRTLSAEDAQEQVRELAGEGGRIAWKQHAYDRLEEREITATQVINVLKRGKVVEAPQWDVNYQNWKFGVQEISAGELLTVRVALDVERLMGKVVLVITAYIK